MGQDFYDSNGHPYSYIDDGGNTMFTFDGTPIAYIDGDSVYAFSGEHLGFFEHGHVWDHSGSVVLFTNAASGGPLKPVKALKPLKALKQLKPLKAAQQLKPLKSLRTTTWSDASPESLFEE